MPHLEVFKFNNQDVRVLLGEKIEVVAADLARPLGRRDGTAVARMAKPEEKRKAVVETSSGPQTMLVVDERGLERIVERTGATELGAWLKATVITAWRAGLSAVDVKKSASASEPAYSLARGFEFEGHALGLEVVDGQPLWNASDFAGALGYRDTNGVTRLLDPAMEGVHWVLRERSTLGGPQRTVWLTMAGVWEVLAQSRKPEAKRLRRYMTTEVMPAIMTRGGYVHPEALAAGVSVEDLAGPPPAPSIQPGADVGSIAHQLVAVLPMILDQVLAKRDAEVAGLKATIAELVEGAAATVAFIDHGDARDFDLVAAELRNDSVIGDITREEIIRILLGEQNLIGEKWLYRLGNEGRLHVTRYALTHGLMTVREHHQRDISSERFSPTPLVTPRGQYVLFTMLRADRDPANAQAKADRVAKKLGAARAPQAQQLALGPAPLSVQPDEFATTAELEARTNELLKTLQNMNPEGPKH